jgi:hypothetical protein
MTPDIGWKKSSRSTSTESCVELHPDGLVRDSKNPAGGTLRVQLDPFVRTMRDPRWDRLSPGTTQGA